MATKEYSSLTKEFPLAKTEETIGAIVPGMSYADLLAYATQNTISAIPGLLRKRFLLVDGSDRVVYDEFLSLVRREGVKSAIVRKVMLFVWAYRDGRIRRFILERVTNANGKWSVAKLTNKSNADFFTQGGAKARSNFEHFLVETGIFDPSRREIHLELDDHWLEEAARVAAQHERDPEFCRQLLENPYKFLADHGWMALANATKDELIRREPELNYDAEPGEDDLIAANPKRRSAPKPWSRKKPRSGDKTSTSAMIDLVARERANQSHHAIEMALNEKIRERRHEPLTNENIDIFFTCEQGSVIVEVKSCTEKNIHAQIRKGVSQLLEYRYLYSDQLTAPVHLALAIEAKPGPETSWLVEYLETLGIALAWLDGQSGQLVTCNDLPTLLNGIFVNAPLKKLS